MKIEKYTPAYKEQVRSVCLKTAHGRMSRRKRAFLLSMYCDHYLDHGTAFVLTDVGNVVRGYILCAENWDDYIRDMAPRAAAFPLLYSILAKMEFKSYRTYREAYPAHLHIDILESYTGCGKGKLLMQTLLDHLREQQVPGVMLNVAASNHRAIRFYEKCGFTLLKDNKFSLTLGMKL